MMVPVATKNPPTYADFPFIIPQWIQTIYKEMGFSGKPSFIERFYLLNWYKMYLVRRQ
jgi:hypothetical protein